MSLEFLSVELAIAVISLLVAIVANFIYVKSKLDVLANDVKDITDSVHREAVNNAALSAIVTRLDERRRKSRH